MTHTVYAYHPRSIRSLSELLEHEFVGEDKRFYRYTANLIRVIASGKRIEIDDVAGFSREVEQAYKSPWMTAANNYGHESGEEIVNNLLKGGGNI